ncbi:MAG TPA: hypothetical protein VEW42_02965 [Candidatus Eisenbacteria bacterium]|nr:hypothetical protein [Candidatus Eisenbacteria bacterium]
MSYPLSVKEEAIRLRKQGLSLREISEKLNIAKSTSSAWLENISLSVQAQGRLAEKQILGQYKSVLIKKEKRKKEGKARKDIAIKMLRSLQFSQEQMKTYCALLWWCEGNKDMGLVKFTNSDPSLIQNFLFTLRSGFALDESKFRVLVHIHEYHDDEKQKKFWSDITNIPLQQFHRSYEKLNIGKRKHDNYQGCIAVTYYDAKIAKELEAIYNAFTLVSGGVR